MITKISDTCKRKHRIKILKGPAQTLDEQKPLDALSILSDDKPLDAPKHNTTETPDRVLDALTSTTPHSSQTNG